MQTGHLALYLPSAFLHLYSQVSPCDFYKTSLYLIDICCCCLHFHAKILPGTAK